MNGFNALSTESKIEIAGQMVIMDAIEKGYTDRDGLINYMQSKSFESAVLRYVDMMN